MIFNKMILRYFTKLIRHVQQKRLFAGENKKLF